MALVVLMEILTAYLFFYINYLICAGQQQPSACLLLEVILHGCNIFFYINFICHPSASRGTSYGKGTGLRNWAGKMSRKSRNEETITIHCMAIFLSQDVLEIVDLL